MRLPFLAVLIGIAGVCAGSYAPVAHGRARFFVPVSGAVLLVVSLFSILPETAGQGGWARAGMLYACGYLLLYAIDRYVHPVCPSCSHTHDHGHCEIELHGFSGPLVIATSIHAFIDGWSMVLAQGGSDSLRSTVPFAVLLHKIPEGLALGVMLRASLKALSTAAMWGSAAEAMTAVGALTASALLAGASPAWGRDILAVVGGTFLYMGFQAVHGALGRPLLSRRG